MISVMDHPLLDLYAFVTTFPKPIGEMQTPQELKELLSLDSPAAVQSSAKVREEIRALLRHGGFKPAGRSKPASEYLIKAGRERNLSPINLAVDCCNVVSLHSGLPISVVDLDLVFAPLSIAIASPGSTYVFNSSGQEIDLKGLLCLFDGQGPCANAVRDSQRTKTNANTQNTLSLIWSSVELPDMARQAEEWYRKLLEQSGAKTERALLMIA